MFKNLFKWKPRWRKNTDYIFIGYLKPLRKKNCFTAALYYKGSNTAEIYAPGLSGETIRFFERFLVKGDIIHEPKARRRVVKPGDDAIHCFITGNKEVTCGTRKELEPKLLQLLFEENLAPGTGLIISSFLHLHGKTEQYLLGAISKNKNIHIHFKREDFIDTAWQQVFSKIKFLEDIFLRVEKLKKIVPALSLDDVALFKDQQMFFNASSCNIKDVLFDENESYNTTFRKLMTMSPRAYFHTLTSDNIVRQHKIDSILSVRASNVLEQTVLDVGINIEAELAVKRLQLEEEAKRPADFPEPPMKTDGEYEDLFMAAKKIKAQMAF